MTLGQRIKTLRKEKKMTLVDLAGDRITKGMLSLIENDKSKPSMETLDYLSNALNVSIGYLTQLGDEAWTAEIIENKVFKDTFQFPNNFIETQVLPNIDKIADSQNGMRLYHVLRMYYRYNQKPENADAVTEKIARFYKEKGLLHLVLLDTLNDVTSMMYSNDYFKAYHRLLTIEADVKAVVEYDSSIEFFYLYLRSLFAMDYDPDDFVSVSERLIELCCRKEHFNYYAPVNRLLGLYHGLLENWAAFERCEQNIRDYLKFNRKSSFMKEVYSDETPIRLYYLLVDDSMKTVVQLESFKKERARDADEAEIIFWERYADIIDTEIKFHKGQYQSVIDHYSKDMYHRPLANHPADRILMAVRASVYPLSLYYTGDTEAAKAAFTEIEAGIDDIKYSVLTKELYMIKRIIFDTE